MVIHLCVLWRGMILVSAALVVCLSFTGVALAADHGQADSSPGANLPYLLGMYTVSWLAFFAYAFYITRRQRGLRRQIEDLRRSLDERKV